MTVYYLDSSATYNGDGSTYTPASGAGQPGALNTLVGKVFAANDIIWARRSNTAMVLSAIYTGNLNNVSLYGWPLSTDDHYGIRPSDPQATWDGDSAQFFKMTGNNLTNVFNPSIPPSIIRRLWVDSTVAYNTGGYIVTALINLVGNNLDVRYIQSTCSNFIPTGTTTAGKMFTINGLNPTARDIYIRGSVMSAGYTICDIISSGNGGYVNNITIDTMNLTSSQSGAGTLYVLATSGSVQDLVLENITINILDPTSANKHGSSFIYVNGGTCRIYDITVNNAYNGNTYMGPMLVINDGVANTQITQVQTTGTMGSIYIGGNNNIVDITNWNAVYPMTSNVASGINTNNYPIMFVNGSGSKLTINNGILSTASPNCKPIWNNAGNGIVVKLNNVLLNAYINLINNNAQTYNTQLTCINHNKNVGLFYYENKFGILITSNVYRTGGYSTSIKSIPFMQRLGQNARSLVFSPKGNETEFLILNAGINTVTLYGCYTNWSGSIKALPDCRDIGFSFTYIDNNGNYQYVSTFSDSPLPSDTSTWSNDTNLVAFKISVTVNLNVQQLIPIAILSSMTYDLNGRLYFDPQLVRT